MSPPELETKLQALRERAGPPDPPAPDQEHLEAVHAQGILEAEMKDVINLMHFGTVPPLPADTKNDRARIVKLLVTVEDKDLPVRHREAIADYLSDLVRRQAGLRYRKRT